MACWNSSRVTDSFYHSKYTFFFFFFFADSIGAKNSEFRDCEQTKLVFSLKLIGQTHKLLVVCIDYFNDTLIQLKKTHASV